MKQVTLDYTAEEPLDFTPNFQAGLLPTIVQDAESLEVLMLAYMNEEAWQLTLKTGEAHYFSRSRQKLWHKGEVSGHTQTVKAIRLDCDNDTILLLVKQKGQAACHTGRQSCFFRELKDNKIALCSPKIFDPKEVYGQ
ncbi:MAG: phosphoribosyl-AMP cyclohydrolase [Desulfovibrio sp.]|nr:phosphoribosyl-AMP cyclohydrolase [Desulfovibrio sp.]